MFIDDKLKRFHKVQRITYCVRLISSGISGQESDPGINIDRNVL